MLIKIQKEDIYACLSRFLLKKKQQPPCKYLIKVTDCDRVSEKLRSYICRISMKNPSSSLVYEIDNSYSNNVFLDRVIRNACIVLNDPINPVFKRLT